MDQALGFLNGNFREVLQDLSDKMNRAAEELKYEEAAEYRDLMDSVRRIGEHQKITSGDGEDKDVAALALDREDAVAQVFFIRDGKLIGREHFYLRAAAGEERRDVLLSFIKQFYAGTPFIPRELMISEEVEEQEILEEWLTAKRGQKVHIRVPKKGTKEKLVELAQRNAEIVPQPGPGAAEAGGRPNHRGRKRDWRVAGHRAAGADRSLRYLQHQRIPIGRLHGSL